jgi:hypothetical protein
VNQHSSQGKEKQRFTQRIQGVVYKIMGVKLEIFLLTLILCIALLTFNMIFAEETVYEDQFILCNFVGVCTVFNADSYMSRETIDKLWKQFDKDLDTFGISDIRK